MRDELEFWEWFERNEAKFRDVDVPEKEELLDELLAKLQAYCEALWFETGTADDGIHELIISAEGDVDHFSAVRKLVASAPPIGGWRFIAFKPANGFDFDTEYQGITFSPEATWFVRLRSPKNPSALGIRVGYAHYDAARHESFMTGTCIMLECALGELAFAESVHHVEVSGLPSSPESSGYVPISELVNFVGDPAVSE